MDFYGGWKKSWGDWGLDVGAIYYYYPRHRRQRDEFPRQSQERQDTYRRRFQYGALHRRLVKWISAKYYYAVSDYFSLPDTNGSRYFDLSANYDMGNGWTLIGHLGSFKLDNWKNGARGTDADYTDWKIGVTKDLSGWVLGAAYIDNNAKGSCAVQSGAAEFYCFGNSASGATKFKDASSGTVVFSVSKTF
jgi:uncharacterized protein (TIGR02001 family)